MDVHEDRSPRLLWHDWVLVTYLLWITWYLQIQVHLFSADGSFLQTSCLPPGVYRLICVVSLGAIFARIFMTLWRASRLYILDVVFIICELSLVFRHHIYQTSSTLWCIVHFLYATLTFYRVCRRRGCLSKLQVVQISLACFLLDTLDDHCTSSVEQEWYLFKMFWYGFLTWKWIGTNACVGHQSTRATAFFTTALVVPVIAAAQRETGATWSRETGPAWSLPTELWWTLCAAVWYLR